MCRVADQKLLDVSFEDRPKVFDAVELATIRWHIKGYEVLRDVLLDFDF